MYKLALFIVDGKVVKINQISFGFDTFNLEGEAIKPLFLTYEEVTL